MKYLGTAKPNQHKIQVGGVITVIDADSQEEAIRIYNDNYTPLLKTKRKLLNKIKQKAKELLTATDYKVIRHRDQRDKVVSKKSISDVEYMELLTERDRIRDRSNEMEAEVEKLTTVEEIENFNIEF